MFIVNIVNLRPLDITAIAVYMLGIAAIALFFAKKNNSTEQYFLGNRSFPGWVIGLSMVGTSISSNSFLGIPAETYKSSWIKIAPNLFLPIVTIIAIVLFIPFFRSSKRTSAFEYLNERYGVVPRLYGTLSFIILQLARVVMVLLLLCLPIQFLTGYSIEYVIAVVGIFVALYTIIGGIETVIWTDVIQTIVLLVGGVLCFSCIWYKMPGGLTQIMEIATDNNKFHIGDFDWDLGRKTFWVIMFTGLVHWLREYSSDQNVVQRYFAAKSTKEARKATAICACFSIPIWVFFAFLGTALFAFYAQFPVADLDKQLGRPENILPFFIINNIPAGIAGIIIAGLLAAAMSSLDSSLNAISTVTVVDIIKPYTHKGHSDKFYLNIAKAIIITASLIMVFGAILATKYNNTVVDLVWIINSTLGGCLVGLFLLGLFTTRVDNTSASIGLVIAIVANIYLILSGSQLLPEMLVIDVDSYWTGIIVNIVFVAAAYTTSWIKKPSQQNLDKLTIWTMKKGE
ncbi:sodium/solute symporter [Candidatus Uabimicrobium sp. HlEnr_7]|uniref:sodium:solute symporter family transporter n=1 Tax=Candidatus Uabimicrobium helgolandensis TaxID=3095367 RepID=UPI0035575B46